ncbi:MAG TPA: STAS domain-containing protein [Acidimicrobiales bacterium]|nr:STAS domain-containing protein [Acidimicrobiales bacterium]
MAVTFLHETSASGARLRIAGVLDASVDPATTARLRDLALGPVTDVVIELGRITALDSVGVGLIADLADALRRKGGGLALAGNAQAVEQVLSVTGLGELFRTPR